MKKRLTTCFLILIVTGTMMGYLAVGAAIPAETQAPEDTGNKTVEQDVPIDEFDRGTPRGTVEGFLSASRNGEYEKAAQYLDLRNLPGRVAKEGGPELARKLKIVLDRALWVDLEKLSTDPEGQGKDGLPAFRDILDRIETPKKTIDILLQHVPREDGVFIWKFSNKTVRQIPLLWEHHGYSMFEKNLRKIFPDIMFLGWHAWQWIALFILMTVAYLGAMALTWIVSFLLRHRDTEMSHRLADFIKGPVRLLIWIFIIKLCIPIIGLTLTMRKVLKAETLFTIILAWVAIRLVDIIIDWMSERLAQDGKESASVLLRPLKTVLKVVVIITAAVIWMDNVGFQITTILAGLGVGGLAVALACQDTLKNLIGSVMILLDKPYEVGQRIVVKGHDGVVEEIGLRSTRLRLLTGHQTTIPNDEMARLDIENIGRRPHIRRLTNIAIPNNTPLERIEKAVKIIEGILHNHEGMDPELTPRVYFNEFNRDSLNIMILYWYHPADYWAFLDLNQRVNRQILQEFESEGIKLALPSSATFLNQEDEKPLLMNISQQLQPKEPQAG
ncbi:MAG: mechanosensitive ion channel family protein [Deltaproteobacteria bacterium]|nr:mechanosensitive ion channel family protein [Deltaproteobacteria bacterium]